VPLLKIDSLPYLPHPEAPNVVHKLLSLIPSYFRLSKSFFVSFWIRSKCPTKLIYDLKTSSIRNVCGFQCGSLHFLTTRKNPKKDEFASSPHVAFFALQQCLLTYCPFFRAALSRKAESVRSFGSLTKTARVQLGCYFKKKGTRNENIQSA